MEKATTQEIKEIYEAWKENPSLNDLSQNDKENPSHYIINVFEWVLGKPITKWDNKRNYLGVNKHETTSRKSN